MNRYPYIVLTLVFILSGCHKITSNEIIGCLYISNNCIIEEAIIPVCHEEEYISDGFDILLVIGQSNVHSGLGIDSRLDKAYPNIKQLGRHDENDMKILDAQEPLDHHSKLNGRIGFVLTFAKMYACEILENQRKILIIPCGLGGSGFINNRWNKGKDLYEDAVFRVNYILENYPNSNLKAILWHQGEVDVENPDYQDNLNSMIINIRKDIKHKENREIPFILGGMVPFWVDQLEARILQECTIKDTPERIDLTGFADPRNPCTIVKEDNTIDETHYDSHGQREMGRRYFNEYKKIYSSD